MGHFLVAGANSDEDLHAVKGPTIMNDDERTEILKHCKFVDKVVKKTVYMPTL